MCDILNVRATWFNFITILIGSNLLCYQIDQILLLTNLVTFYTNKDYWWDAFFRNNDGFITKQEMLNATKKLTEKQVKLQTLSVKILLIDIWLSQKVGAVFARNDKDGDGKLSKEEFKDMMQRKEKKT